MYNDLKARDKAVNWHPYTQMKTANEIIPIVRGEGAYLYDANGKRYIDAVSSWWVTLHGHAHPHIAKRVSEQLLKLEQVIFAGFTHEPAIQLSEQLLHLLPANQQKVFYTDNGSTAVEVALKMCVQYAYNHGLKKTKILAFENAYHGDTFGAMSVSSRSKWTEPFGDLLFEVIYIETPTKNNFERTKAIIEEHRNELACFIYEPLVQGAAGMLMHEPEDLDRLMQYCRSKEILMIQDEIFVGFGRTGRLFAADHLAEKPDIMCFSKGLTGGTFPLGLTTCSQEIYEAFYADDPYKTLFHGHSFTANPLACTAALASLELLLSEETQYDIQRICKEHEQFVAEVDSHPKIKRLRQCGTILAIELQIEENSSYFNQQYAYLYTHFLNEGIILRPLGNILYLVPPYCLSSVDLHFIYHTIKKVLDPSQIH
ncbi:adenosylmethionine--8-amino-7-oxononanoate transaminase [Dyadobacter sp. LHD-138]|uniref:adenosylmethionine--8-amino-7-oxononanoate transaminase n=1 Tax=Dyadobacter sp. LHD-138 TaxID=3071413 RepID=UPI0027DF96E9|nr:adenosylmethionine--8-amino-7-oxononanoate transaminase [Dyadobacter sp. LHD-138]MDQ6479454.1 adenosylmethionine--8-amino-7-oxononanoate transaminase [Dyadobacter sp. LHD-138]